MAVQTGCVAGEDRSPVTSKSSRAQEEEQGLGWSLLLRNTDDSSARANRRSGIDSLLRFAYCLKTTVQVTEIGGER